METLDPSEFIRFYKPSSFKEAPPKVLTLDTHIDLPWIFTKNGYFDLSKNNKGVHSAVDFPRMELGGLNSLFAAIYLSDRLQNDLGPEESRELIEDQFYWFEDKAQVGAVIVDTAKDAFRVIDSGLVPVFFGLEGGRLIENSLTRLNDFRKSKVRYLTLTHNFNTDWADSSTDAPRHQGLTEFGVDVLKECEKLGIYIDISHASDKTAEAVFSHATKPVIASHSGCRAIVDLPRNIPDYLIKEVAKSGGIVSIPFARRFVGTAKGILNHINHVVQLVGIDHVGIGSDLDGAEMVKGAESVSAWRKVLKWGLTERGYKIADINKILGMNMMRLL